MDDLRLRPTHPEDVERVLAWEGAPENAPFVTHWPGARHLAAIEDPGVEHRILEEPDGTPVGYLILAGLDSPNRSIELTRVVVAAKGRGYGRAAVRWAKAFAFDELSAHRLWLDVFPDNERARHLYETEGFHVEGTLRECVLHQGVFRSLLVLSILVTEWRADGPPD